MNLLDKILLAFFVTSLIGLTVMAIYPVVSLLMRLS